MKYESTEDSYTLLGGNRNVVPPKKGFSEQDLGIIPNQANEATRNG